MSGRLLTDSDINYLRSVYPEIDLPAPTGQQELLIAHYFRGGSHSAAARAAGYRDLTRAREYLQSPHGETFIKYLRDRELTDIRITRETVTSMFMEAYHQAATATEKIAAARELGKLHGLYPDQRKTIDVNVNTDGNQVQLSQLNRIGNSELLKLASPDLLALLTQDEPIDGEFVEVADDHDA